MKWLTLGLAFAAVAFYAIGSYIDHSGASRDESVAAVIPWIIALVLAVIDAGVLIVWVTSK